MTIGSIGLKVLESYLSDDWQSVDDIKDRCLGMTRTTVAYGLATLYEFGVAVRRLDPSKPKRSYQYRRNDWMTIHDGGASE